MFCNKCGATLDGAGGSCARCGTAVVGIPAAKSAGPSVLPRVISNESRGVGGWLMFFCVVFGVIRPLAVTAWIMPRLSPTSPLTYFILAEIAFGMIVAVLLWREQREALTFLRAFFMASALFNLFRLVQYVLAKHGDGGTVRFVWGIIVLVLWYSYFHKSVRIRNTYGRNI